MSMLRSLTFGQTGMTGGININLFVFVIRASVLQDKSK